MVISSVFISVSLIILNVPWKSLKHILKSTTIIMKF